MIDLLKFSDNLKIKKEVLFLTLHLFSDENITEFE